MPTEDPALERLKALLQYSGKGMRVPTYSPHGGFGTPGSVNPFEWMNPPKTSGWGPPSRMPFLNPTPELTIPNTLPFGYHLVPWEREM